jgi:hypothetical protein
MPVKEFVCAKNPGSCEFYTFQKAHFPFGVSEWKMWLEDSCCFKVIFSKERKDHGKKSGGDKFSVSKDQSIFDHSQTCNALGQRRNNSLNLWCEILKGAQRMVTFGKSPKNN